MLFKINYSLDALKGVNFEREFESVTEMFVFATFIEVINVEKDAGTDYLSKPTNKEMAENSINFYWEKIFDENLSNDVKFNSEFSFNSSDLYYQIRDILDYELIKKEMYYDDKHKKCYLCFADYNADTRMNDALKFSIKDYREIDLVYYLDKNNWEDCPEAIIYENVCSDYFNLVYLDEDNNYAAFLICPADGYNITKFIGEELLVKNIYKNFE